VSCSQALAEMYGSLITASSSKGMQYLVRPIGVQGCLG